MKKFNLQILLQVFVLALCLPNFAAAQISFADRSKTFNKVWETINKKYYDPNFNGVDWNKIREDYRPRIEAAKDDKEFYALIKQMVGELHDAHSSFRTLPEAELHHKKQSVRIGLQVKEIEGKIVVASVAPNSEAAKANVQPGMIITAIDGRNSLDALAEAKTQIKSSTPRAVRLFALRQLFLGQPETSIKLGLMDKTGTATEITLTRRVEPWSNSPLVSRSLASGIGYIKFDRFFEPIVKPYKKALADLKDTKGLIIDLRENGGGDVSVVQEMVSWLFGKKVPFGKLATRSGDSAKFLGISLLDEEVGDPKKQLYSAPIIVLTSGNSASGAEVFSAVLQENERAKIVGQQSCGCVLGVRRQSDVKEGELQLSELNVISPKGKRYEGIGVTPDLIIEPTINDLQNNRDRALEAAEKLLNSAAP